MRHWTSPGIVDTPQPHFEACSKASGLIPADDARRVFEEMQAAFKARQEAAINPHLAERLAGIAATAEMQVVLLAAMRVLRADIAADWLDLADQESEIEN